MKLIRALSEAVGIVLICLGFTGIIMASSMTFGALITVIWLVIALIIAMTVLFYNTTD